MNMSEVKTMKDFWAPDCKTVFVFGAGMEMGKDIGLCSADDLPASVIQYATGKGCKVSDKVKKNFKKADSFETLISKRIDGLFCNDDKLKNRNKNISKYSGSEISKLFLKFQSLAESLRSGGDLQVTLEKLQEQLQVTFPIDGDLCQFLDTEKIAFSYNWKKLIEFLINQYLKGCDRYTEDDKSCIRELVKSIIDYDSLLTDNYIGFYSGNKSAKSRYLYLSWILWCFLADKDKSVNVEDTIYAKALNYTNNLTSIITMNYSTVIDRILKQNNRFNEIIHFHGDLAHSINKKREENEISDYESQDLIALLDNIYDGCKDEEDYPIPSMMPPLDIKPLISNKYLERWVKAKNIIDEADRIVVVGYSFSKKDDHFNDMLFNANPRKVKKIVIVRKDFKEDDQIDLKKRFSPAMKDKVEMISKTAEEFFAEG